MLVRALKVLNYFVSEQSARASTRQPLISRAMKSALMAEPVAISNDEPWSMPADKSPDATRGVVKMGREKMTISARPTASFANFRPIRALRWVFAATVLAAIAGAPVTADAARPAGMAAPGAF